MSIYAAWAGAGVLDDAGSVAVVVLAAVIAWMLMNGPVANKIRSCKGRLPPGPKGYPVIGNLLELAESQGEVPHRAMARLSRKYGPIVFLQLGFVPTVVISDSTLAKACLSGANDKLLASRPRLESVRRMTFGQTTGIAMTPYGDSWKNVRRFCSLQLFTTKRVCQFEPVRRREIAALVHNLRQKGEERVNLTEAAERLTECMTCEMLLGKPMAEVQGNLEGAGIVNLQDMAKRITEAFMVPMISDFIPPLGFLDRRAKANLDEIHAGLDVLWSKLFEERKQRSPDSPQVLLDLLLENFNADHVKSIMTELLTAAIDTSSTALDWAMAELLAHPQVMSRLQQELDEVTKGEGRLIEEEELGKLVYVKAVLKEAMRLHPPVPLMVPHLSTTECQVDGYRIPKGSRVLVNIWAIGRDPDSWSEPGSFLPERFLTVEGALVDFRGQHFEFLPFGSGRRICPGMPMAIPLLESALANLVHGFNWRLPPGESVDFSERFGTVVNRAHPLFAIPSVRHAHYLG